MTNQNDVVQRVAALESDVAQFKEGTVTKIVVDQVLTYLGRLDSNLAGVREDTSQIKGDVSRIKAEVSQLTNRVDRLEQNVSAMREDMQGMTNEFRHLRDEL